MGAPNSDNVKVAVTGGVYTADSGTTLPDDAITALAGTYTQLGYVGEDGITEAHGTETNDIRAWQHGAVVRRVQTSHDLTYALTFLETTPEVLEAYYGDYTAGPGGASGSVQITGQQSDRRVWVFDVVDGDDRIRLVIPDGQVTERSDVQYANGEAIAYGVTITAYPDANSVKAYVYYETGGAS